MTMVRPVAVRDLDDLMVLEEQAFLADAWSLSAYTEYAAAGGRADVVEHRGKPRAVCWYGPRRETTDWEIASVATSTKYRGRGFAATLVRKAAATARAHGAKGLVLEVRTSNATARELYGRLGFRVTRAIERYYDDGEDAVEMRLNLEKS